MSRVIKVETKINYWDGEIRINKDYLSSRICMEYVFNRIDLRLVEYLWRSFYEYMSGWNFFSFYSLRTKSEKKHNIIIVGNDQKVSKYVK